MCACIYIKISHKIRSIALELSIPDIWVFDIPSLPNFLVMLELLMKILFDTNVIALETSWSSSVTSWGVALHSACSSPSTISTVFRATLASLGCRADCIFTACTFAPCRSSLAAVLGVFLHWKCALLKLLCHRERTGFPYRKLIGKPSKGTSVLSAISSLHQSPTSLFKPARLFCPIVKSSWTQIRNILRKVFFLRWRVSHLSDAFTDQTVLCKGISSFNIVTWTLNSIQEMAGYF